MSRERTKRHRPASSSPAMQKLIKDITFSHEHTCALQVYCAAKHRTRAWHIVHVAPAWMLDRWSHFTGKKHVWHLHTAHVTGCQPTQSMFATKPRSGLVELCDDAQSSSVMTKKRPALGI